MKTIYGVSVDGRMFRNRLGDMINQFYKILPLSEDNNPTRWQYMEALQRELLGLHSLISALEYDGQYLKLLAILEYIMKNECNIATIKSDVFKAIGILQKLQKKFDNAEE